MTNVVHTQPEDGGKVAGKSRKSYRPPAVIEELELEVQAGSIPPTPIVFGQGPYPNFENKPYDYP